MAIGVLRGAGELFARSFYRHRKEGEGRLTMAIGVLRGAK